MVGWKIPSPPPRGALEPVTIWWCRSSIRASWKGLFLARSHQIPHRPAWVRSRARSAVEPSLKNLLDASAQPSAIICTRSSAMLCRSPEHVRRQTAEHSVSQLLPLASEILPPLADGGIAARPRRRVHSSGVHHSPDAIAHGPRRTRPSARRVAPALSWRRQLARRRRGCRCSPRGAGRGQRRRRSLAERGRSRAPSTARTVQGEHVAPRQPTGLETPALAERRRRTDPLQMPPSAPSRAPLLLRRPPCGRPACGPKCSPTALRSVGYRHLSAGHREGQVCDVPTTRRQREPLGRFRIPPSPLRAAADVFTLTSPS